jgi:hypothetical protein
LRGYINFSRCGKILRETPENNLYIKEGFFKMNENTKRIMTVTGAVLTALAIALSMLAFLTVTARAATGTGMPAMTDIIPDKDGTSALTLPEGGNADSDDVLTPDDTTRAPVTLVPESSARPATSSAPAVTGTDTGMLEEEGGGMLGAVIAVIAVVAIILVVIALIPRKKK